jgi:EAL domain-containing protein (putative c-di-GMP-specific phosphodiesterase class I)/GGDEF domain-containing protein
MSRGFADHLILKRGAPLTWIAVTTVVATWSIATQWPDAGRAEALGALGLTVGRLAFDYWCWRRSHLAGAIWIDASELWILTGLVWMTPGQLVLVLLATEFLLPAIRACLHRSDDGPVAVGRELLYAARVGGQQAVWAVTVGALIYGSGIGAELRGVLAAVSYSAFALVVIWVELRFVRRDPRIRRVVSQALSGSLVTLPRLLASGLLVGIASQSDSPAVAALGTLAGGAVLYSLVEAVDQRRWRDQLRSLVADESELTRGGENLDEIRERVLGVIRDECGGEPKFVTEQPTGGLWFEVPGRVPQEWISLEERSSTLPIESERYWFEVLARYCAAAMQSTDLRQTADDAVGRAAEVQDELERVLVEMRVDPTTGWPNRRTFTDDLTARITAGDDRLVVVAWSISNWDAIVEQFGAAAAQRTLRMLSERWTNTVPADVALGSTDDGVLLGVLELQSGSRADALIGSIRAATPPNPTTPLIVETEFGDVPVLADPEIGVAWFGLHGVTGSELVASAMGARSLVLAGIATTVEDAVDAAEPSRHDLRREWALFQAATTNSPDLFIAVQPIVHSGTREVVGAEALVRWTQNGQLQNPGELIAMSEMSTLIEHVSQRVFDDAAAFAARLRATGRAVPVSVNVSTRLLVLRSLPRIIAGALDRAGLPAELLKLELTEGEHLDPDNIDAIDTLLQLRKAGHLLSIDDFGTGYSSLQRLAELPFTQLKIDRTFVLGCETDDSVRRRLLSMRLLADAAGMETVVEGVETLDQVKVLAALGLYRIQGFVFARPMRVSEFDFWQEQLSTNAELQLALAGYEP